MAETTAAGQGREISHRRVLAIAMAAPLDLLQLDRAVAHVMDDERPLALAARHLAPMQ